jgi:ABC-2 type transport system permease protein
MTAAIAAEFIKLKRSSLLWLVILGGILPSLVRAAQHSVYDFAPVDMWAWHLSAYQEIFVFCTAAVLIIVAVTIFTMEFQNGTASYIFTSATSRLKIYAAKLLILLLIIFVMFVTGAAMQLLMGSILLPIPITQNKLIQLIEITLWYIGTYFALAVFVAMVAAISKRFVISTGILFGYFILSFPVHYFGENPYVDIFMIPALGASKMYDSSVYLIGNYYDGVPIDIARLAGVLAVLALAALIIGIVAYKKTDTIMPEGVENG